MQYTNSGRLEPRFRLIPQSQVFSQLVIPTRPLAVMSVNSAPRNCWTALERKELEWKQPWLCRFYANGSTNGSQRYIMNGTGGRRTQPTNSSIVAPSSRDYQLYDAASRARSTGLNSALLQAHNAALAAQEASPLYEAAATPQPYELDYDDSDSAPDFYPQHHPHYPPTPLQPYPSLYSCR